MFVSLLIKFFILFLQILKDIELFYLLPHQRRWNHWFPDIM